MLELTLVMVIATSRELRKSEKSEDVVTTQTATRTLRLRMIEFVEGVLRPKHGDIVEFDRVSNEYVCWFDAFKVGKRELEFRFVVGYSKDGSCEFIHYVGPFGPKKDHIDDNTNFSLLFVKKPVLGTAIVVALLCVVCIDEVGTKIGLRVPFGT